MNDIVFIKDGKEYSAREAMLHALSHGQEYIDTSKADAREALERLGYRVKEEKKSFLRNFRARFRAWVRARLTAWGVLPA